MENDKIVCRTPNDCCKFLLFHDTNETGNETKLMSLTVESINRKVIIERRIGESLGLFKDTNDERFLLKVRLSQKSMFLCYRVSIKFLTYGGGNAQIR